MLVYFGYKILLPTKFKSIVAQHCRHIINSKCTMALLAISLKSKKFKFFSLFFANLAPPNGPFFIECYYDL